jgi:carboxyl-terminal processing protease
LAALTGTALNGFLSVFRDPHTYILPVRYYQEVLSRGNASSTALGIVLARSAKSYYLRKVMEGSPSAKAGLRRGDWILSVNGMVLRDLPPQRLGEMLKVAVPDQITKLEVRRGAKKFVVEIRREKTELASVVWKKSDGLRPVGILTIHKFAHETCEQTKSALKQMNAAGLRGLIVDLRDNSGGQMDEAACIISLFVGPEKNAFSIKYLDPSKEPESYQGPEQIVWTKSLAIVVNGGTASASEILAGSLRDHGRAVLVGERTFGKGSFQEGEIWNRNRKIAFFQTKGFYYLPSGYSPQLRGLEPDVKVNFRDSLQMREEDQYMNPLNPPTLLADLSQKRIDLSSCLDSGDASLDDEQLSKARVALFCSPVALGGLRASGE